MARSRNSPRPWSSSPRTPPEPDMPPGAPVALKSKQIGPWKGMNEKVSPDLLPKGVAANLQNLLLDEVPGKTVKRNGGYALAALPSGSPPRDYFVFTKRDGTSYLLVSDGTKLYYSTDPSATPTELKT